ncbi:MAG: hypothetical protein KDD03_06935 [Gelidibacter sp.]|nr:hypothetical protein [Gelidibacter sp.]
MERLELRKVKFLPQNLDKGLLYVSEEYSIAGHLCPCGCQNKIMTPLGSTEWSFNDDINGPTLYPSLGNWQLPCKSHYWIIDGEIVWSHEWSEEEILAGQKAEEKRRIAYYEGLDHRNAKQSFIVKIIKWIKSVFK